MRRNWRHALVQTIFVVIGLSVTAHVVTVYLLPLLPILAALALAALLLDLLWRRR